MILPLCLLCFLSINIGFLTKDLFIGFGTNFWGSSLFVLSNNYLLVDSEFIPTFYKIFPLICTILGSLISFFIYNFKLNSFFNLKLNNHFLNKLILGLNRKWFFDRIYTEFITQKVLNISYFFSYQNIDRGFVEQFGPFKIVHFFRFISNSLLNFQNGSIFHYMIILTFSIYLYILFIF